MRSLARRTRTAAVQGEQRNHKVAGHPSTERRDFFRIEDRVILDYAVVSRQTARDTPAERHFRRSSTFHLMRELRGIDFEHHSALHRLAEYDREVEQLWRALNRKIEFVAQALVELDQYRSDSDPQPVSLSEGGIAFTTIEPIPEGSVVALQIQLLPDYMGLTLYGEVVHNQHERHAPTPRTAVNFIELREAQRQILARHIMQVQINERRRRKEVD